MRSRQLGHRVRVGERVPEWLIHAQPTMTLALPKLGLEAGLAAGLVGELYLADIGVPPQLYAEPRLQLAVPDMFARSDPARLQ